MVVNFDVKWCDDLLKWNTTEQLCLNRKNRSEILFQGFEIWTPDIVPANGPGVIPNRNSKLQYPVLVICNGIVRWSYPEKLVAFCEIDVKNFPFDRQYCSILLQSVMHDAHEMKLRSLYSAVRLYNFIETEWSIQFATIDELDVYNAHRGRNFSTIKISIEVRRSSIMYLMKIIVPYSIISALALFSFCLPTDSGEKIALTVSTLLSITIYLQTISEAVPKTEMGVCRLTLYANTLFCLVFLSCVSNIFTAFMHYHQEFFLPKHEFHQSSKSIYSKIYQSLIVINKHRCGCRKTSTIQPSEQADTASRNILRDLSSIRQLLVSVRKRQSLIRRPQYLSSRERKFQRATIFIDRVLFIVYSTSMLVCVILILGRPTETSFLAARNRSNQLIDLRKTPTDAVPLYSGCPK